MLAPQSASRRRTALEFLLGRIDYERSLAMPYNERHYKLDRMRDLLARLGNPHHKLPIVHVAGTKGKGSTSAMISAVLCQAGYRTGLFSSPHLELLEERFRLDEQIATGDELADLVDLVRPVVAEMDAVIAGSDKAELGPTYFELTTAMALLHFVRRGADIAVLEVGMGGRLDSTNVCQPRVCAITSISFDHQKQLGSTLDRIAREKAGIIKPGVPVVCGVLADEPRTEIEAVAWQRGSRLLQLGRDFTFHYQPPRDLPAGDALGRVSFASHRDDWHIEWTDLPLRLPGAHQAANAAVALATLGELIVQGWHIDQAAAARGLAGVQWPARVEVVRRRPTVIVDAAHNVASIEALLATLDECFPAGRRVLVFATTQEKDMRPMLERLLPHFEHVVLTRYLHNPRAVPPEELAALAVELGAARYEVCDTPAAACRRLLALLSPDDLGCITGSFFLAAETRPLLLDSPDTIDKHSADG